MTNVIAFKPKVVMTAPIAPKIEASRQIAPDRSYWLQDLQMAATFAAFVSKDLEAVDMLMSAQRNMMMDGVALTKLPEVIRRRCASYLDISHEEKGKRAKEVFEAIYSR
jgi:hypothetical protein